MSGYKLLAAVGAAAATMVLPAVASASTVTVYAGGPSGWATPLQHKYGAGINNFLINKVVVNVGDSVSWSGTSLAAGFHTVDLPALHGSDVPLLIPTGQNVTGVNDAAGNPFWFSNGQFPVLGFNHALFGASGGHDYNGKARLDSGLPLGPPKDFVVKFTKPGTYKYVCDVHYGMGGEIVVKNKHAAVPTAKQNARTLAHEERNYAKEAKQVLRSKIKAAEVSLGKSGPGGLELFAMFPLTLTIKAGTTVSFVMSQHSREVHTATFGPYPFGPGSYVGKLSASYRSPTGVPDPAAVFPSDPPGHITLGPTTHGNGFASTGVLDRDKSTPTVPAFGAIKFTTPGTYHYQCLIHSFMHGTIIVK